MKTYRTFALAAVGMATLALAAQDGTLLRRELKENATETYKIVSKSTQTVSGTPAGDMDMQSSSTVLYAISVGKVDAEKGTAPIEATTTFEDLKMEGSLASMMGEVPKPSPMKSTGTIDSRNRVTLGATAPKTPQEAMAAQGMSSYMFALFLELPETAVKVGDSWNVTVPKGPFTGKADQQLKATLVKEDGDTLHVKLTGKLNTELDPASMSGQEMPGGMKILIIISTTIQGDVQLLKATGRTKKLDMNMDSTGSVDVNDGQMSMPMGGKSTIGVTLAQTG